MTNVVIIEVVSGIAALVVSAMAFTALSWGEGAASQAMQREFMARAKRLFVVAGVLWAVCFGCYLYLSLGAGPVVPRANPSGMQGGYQE